jgi:ubiquinone biosynthesis monooxygenase Coq7
MNGSDEKLSLGDRLVAAIDTTLRTLYPPPSPESDPEDPVFADSQDLLQEADRRTSEALMRVNHSGEICAQALYRGQAAVCRDAEVRTALERAALEETAHLRWCRRRLAELGGRTSFLDPLWYAGAFAMGAVAALAGARWNLGFVAETERQVVQHLDGHLHELPAGDRRSRAIVARMKDDEQRHATAALEQGAVELPPPVRRLMAFHGRLMTSLSYWV